jgi:vesicle coat complex subunit
LLAEAFPIDKVAALWVPSGASGSGLGSSTASMASGTLEKATSGMRDLISAFSASETRYFDEERYSESELKKALADGLTDKKIDAMKRILAHVSTGRDASNLFPDVVKNVSFASLELKKLIYIYLVQYAENNRDLALLSINSFQKDLSDRSQLVRASALRAMASIKVLEVIQLVMVAVKNASIDSSPYVRKTAAQCMIKVYGVDPDQFFELRALLLKLMNDAEVQVVGSAVMTFHQICVNQPPKELEEPEPSSEAAAETDRGSKAQLSLLHPYFQRLCQNVLLMDSWAQQCCVDLLLRYARLFFACPDAVPEAKTDGSAEGEGDADAAAAPSESPPVVSEDLVALLRALKLMLNSSSQGVTLKAATALCYLAPAKDLSILTKPLLRCLRQAPAESAHCLMSALMPIIEARPDLIRPSIREFFVQSFDFSAMKELKLKILEKLVDEYNVQIVLRELQAYVSWHSHPEFVAQAVQTISHVALKISSVADHCLRGLVKMLDSKCEALACEAVVALRALLQQRHQSSDSGLGSVLPHLVNYLESLTAPTARASVVWIVGQYQQEVPKLAPDVVRKLAKSFVSERQEVKQQILGLSLKVWAFHTLNSQELLPPRPASDKKLPSLDVEESKKLLTRLEALVDYTLDLATYDSCWDVRDTARALRKLKQAAKDSLDAGISDAESGSVGLSYCRACVEGKSLKEGDASSPKAANEDGPGSSLESTWMLGSLAQALDFPLDSYRPVPDWAKENTSDELRKPKAEAKAAKAEAPKSISSDNVGVTQHMEKRVQNPSNITNLPQVQTLEDLDLFYSEDTSSVGKLAAKMPVTTAAAPPTTLEQVSFGAAVGNTPVGTAVFGEDDESDDEDSDEADDADWKYCQGASAVSPPKAQVFSMADDDAPPADATSAPAAVEDPLGGFTEFGAPAATGTSGNEMEDFLGSPSEPAPAFSPPPRQEVADDEL